MLATVQLKRLWCCQILTKNGVISGVRINLIDGDTMKTRDWYQGQFQPDGAWFTYVFSRIE